MMKKLLFFLTLLVIFTGMATAEHNSTHNGIDGFEDGDVDEWNERRNDGSPGLSANNTRAGVGSWSGELEIDSGNNHDHWRPTDIQGTDTLEVYWYTEAASSDGNDEILKWWNGDATGPSGSAVVEVWGNDNLEVNGNEVLSTSEYSAGTWYHIEIRNLDFDTETFDVYIDDEQKASSVNFDTSASQITNVSAGTFAGASYSWHIDEVTFNDSEQTTTRVEIDNLTRPKSNVEYTDSRIVLDVEVNDTADIKYNFNGGSNTTACTDCSSYKNNITGFDGLSDGSHTLNVYAEAGNTDYQSVSFDYKNNITKVPESPYDVWNLVASIHDAEVGISDNSEIETLYENTSDYTGVTDQDSRGWNTVRFSINTIVNNSDGQYVNESEELKNLYGNYSWKNESTFEFVAHTECGQAPYEFSQSNSQSKWDTYKNYWAEGFGEQFYTTLIGCRGWDYPFLNQTMPSIGVYVEYGLKNGCSGNGKCTSFIKTYFESDADTTDYTDGNYPDESTSVADNWFNRQEENMKVVRFPDNADPNTGSHFTQGNSDLSTVKSDIDSMYQNYEIGSITGHMGDSQWDIDLTVDTIQWFYDDYVSNSSRDARFASASELGYQKQARETVTTTVHKNTSKELVLNYSTTHPRIYWTSIAIDKSLEKDTWKVSYDNGNSWESLDSTREESDWKWFEIEFNSDTLVKTEDTEDISPNISYNPSTTQTGTHNQNWILVNVTASDNENLSSVTEEFDGTNSSFNTNKGQYYWTNHTGLSDGQYSFQAHAEDDAGNTNKTANRTFTLDTSPPSTSDNWTVSVWQSQSSAYIELTSSDTDSTVDNISYRVDGGGWTTESGSTATVSISGDSNHTLEYNATDSEGNQESVNTEYVALDNSDPSISFNPSSTNGGERTENWILVNVSASDATSGLSFVRENFNGTNSTFTTTDVGGSYWANHTGLSRGNYTVYAWANDSAGNYVETSSREIEIIDSTAPIVTKIEGLVDKALINFNETSEELSFTSNISDSESGIKSKSCKIGNSASKDLIPFNYNIVNDGFEDGNYNSSPKWYEYASNDNSIGSGDGSASVTTKNVKSGTYSVDIQITKDSHGREFEIFGNDTIDTRSGGKVSAWVLKNSTDGRTTAFLENSSSDVVGFEFEEDEKTYDLSGNEVGSFQIDEWYKVEFTFYKGSDKIQAAYYNSSNDKEYAYNKTYTGDTIDKIRYGAANSAKVNNAASNLDHTAIFVDDAFHSRKSTGEKFECIVNTSTSGENTVNVNAENNDGLTNSTSSKVNITEIDRSIVDEGLQLDQGIMVGTTTENTVAYSDPRFQIRHDLDINGTADLEAWINDDLNVSKVSNYNVTTNLSDPNANVYSNLNGQKVEYNLSTSVSTSNDFRSDKYWIEFDAKDGFNRYWKNEDGNPDRRNYRVNTSITYDYTLVSDLDLKLSTTYNASSRHVEVYKCSNPSNSARYDCSGSWNQQNLDGYDKDGDGLRDYVNVTDISFSDNLFYTVVKDGAEVDTSSDDSGGGGGDGDTSDEQIIYFGEVETEEGNETVTVPFGETTVREMTITNERQSTVSATVSVGDEPVCQYITVEEGLSSGSYSKSGTYSLPAATQNLGTVSISESFKIRFDLPNRTVLEDAGVTNYKCSFDTSSSYGTAEPLNLQVESGGIPIISDFFPQIGDFCFNIPTGSLNMNATGEESSVETNDREVCLSPESLLIPILLGGILIFVFRDRL